MISTFFRHELKAFWRSKNTGKSVAIKVVMAIFLLILFLYVLALGLFLDVLLEAKFPDADQVTIFCGVILLYYLFDLLMRLQLQELPTLRVQPYLHLPISRNLLARYLALSSVLSMFNLWPFVLFLPFIFKVISIWGTVPVLVFITAIIGLTIFNNYLALYIKRKSNMNGWILLIVMTILLIIIICDFRWHLYSVSDISYAFFGRLLTKPLLAVLPLLFAATVYYLNYLYLKQNFYLENLTAHKEKNNKINATIPFLWRFGLAGNLATNEIKLILRNKRSRSSLIMSLFFMFYGLMFYTNPTLGKSWYIFAGMYMSGSFIVTYGQFMFGWQASHFDGLLVSNISFTDFIKAKYLLFNLMATAAFILTIPYVYFGWQVLWVHFVMYLWNIGVNTTIVLFFANRNFKRIDLSKGASFNWEGVGATQLLLTFPLILIPYAIYTPFTLFKQPNVGLGLMAIIALLFILTRNFWIKQLEADYYTKRYQIAEGFRNK
ncbi:DUF5687 family protein [Mucilaginibacter aquaedulcis]|uniref:DUF5687 family protein n=1 Tax=Mucilaginibacter aquaedulcis TaxID=1187081 RepID=UPI0025B438C2|nr:DUF5687 family protein [Mucilaginibacter aquaedulcis]MDN3550655.1 DUF5687 family protein [Mucilaginibacter aquaedulcis]